MSSSFVPSRGQSTVVDATTAYVALAGQLRAGSSEASVQTPVRAAGTFSNLYTYVSSNSVSVNTVCTVRKSGSGTALAVTYSADQTGIKEDTANSVSFANTDSCCLEIAAGSEAGTNNFVIEGWAVQFDATASGDCVSWLVANGSVTYSTASATNYINPAGASAAPTGTEANEKVRIRAASTASNLYGYVSSNGRTTDTTISSRVNGANGNQTITWTSGQTGAKEDTTHTDSLAVGDDYNLKIVTGSGTGNFVFDMVATTLVNTGGKFHLQARKGGSTSVSFGSTIHLGVQGTFLSNGVIANAQVRPRFTFTVKEMTAYVSVNTLNSNAVVTAQDAGSDSSLTFTYSTGQTGWKVDSSNSYVATAATDQIHVKIDTTSSASGSISFYGVGLLGESIDQTMSPDAATVTAAAQSTTTSLTLTLTPDAATETSAGQATTVSHDLALTPDAPAVTASAPSETVALALTVAPDPATQTSSAPSTQTNWTQIPSAATASISAPDPTLDLAAPGDYLYPDPAEVTLSPAGSVTEAFGGINRHITPSPRTSITAPTATLSFGGISVSTGTATLSASAPDPSVAYGDAVRDADASVASVEAPEIGIAHGVATFATDAAGATLTAPEPNVAIDLVLLPGAATAATAAADGSAVPGTKEAAPDAAAVGMAASSPTLALALFADFPAAGVAATAEEVGVEFNYVLRVGAQSVGLLAGHVVHALDTRVAPDPAEFWTSALRPVVAVGPITILHDPASFEMTPTSLPQSYEPQTSITASIVYCAVAYDVVAMCIASAVADARCTVVPDETATTTKGAFPPILPQEPVAT